nr:pyrimidine-nucleoside phosphorylase [Lachnospiraceae bacterium]
MRMYDLIMKKRNGEALSEEEIKFMVNSYTMGEIPDYQMSAMMMAIYFRGMTQDETLALTMAMAESGDILDLSGIAGVKVDKHSTGGVGDKTSLALTPMVAACGVKVAKMSGRGLGHTGGTIDKLESFPGFSTEIELDVFEKNVNEIGISIMGQTKDLAPADKKLYALRDVTATVDQLSLIASSIMSKKLASGADAIVLDVKTGSGAFMKTLPDSVALAEEMVRIGNGAGRKTIAVISDMDQPLGYAVGNALEVQEAIATLRGEGPEDFTKLCMTLGSYMLVAGGKAENEVVAGKMLSEVIENGKALDKLAEFVKAQGGDASYVYEPDKFELARIQEEIPAPESGFIQKIVCDEIGICSLILGGGRETKESGIDLSVGLLLHKKVGDKVEAGESLATIYANDAEKCRQAKERFLAAYTIAPDPKEKEALIKKVIVPSSWNEGDILLI